MPKNCVIIAGPNGSGKTTFAKAYLETYAYEYLSADDIAARLESEQPEKARIQAGRMFFRELSDLISRGKELVIESTLAGLGFQGVIRRLQQAEYTIVIIFVFLETPDTCIARVKDRVRKGGHDVPEADVVRRFFRSRDNFWHIYKNEADFWYLFCNSGEYFQGVALGKKDNYMINNDKLFHLFSKNKKSKTMHPSHPEDIEFYRNYIEIQQIGNRAVQRAQEENRRRGIPNVYSRNGRLCFELPNGELTHEDPFDEGAEPQTDADEKDFTDYAGRGGESTRIMDKKGLRSELGKSESSVGICGSER